MTPDELARQRMIDHQIKDRGIKDEKVLRAMYDVPRHLFAQGHDVNTAYADTPLPIGEGQTISQPYIVAYMTEVALLKPEDKVLEIGTGSGYQAAILSKIVKDVYTIEIIEKLGNNAERIFKENGYNNIHVKIGDGYKGWPEEAPFDAIVITAAPEQIPQGLIKQLKIDGRMIVPVGTYIQELMRITRTKNGALTEKLLPVRFVPMIGEKEAVGSVTPGLVIYKTAGNYNDKVPVNLNNSKNALSSYPDPKDLISGGVLMTPTILHKGYLRDNRGIGTNTAFTNYTYSQYSKLPSVPSATDLLNSIIDKDPLTELWTCPPDLTGETLNQLIDNNKLTSSCTRLK